MNLERPHLRKFGFLGPWKKESNVKAAPVTYAVKSDSGPFTLTSKDFQSIALSTFITDRGDAVVGCGAKVADLKAVLTYRPKTAAKSLVCGELVAIEFVPPAFHFVDDSILNAPGRRRERVKLCRLRRMLRIRAAALNSSRDSMMAAIREALRKPAADEKQEVAFIESSECGGRGSFFYIKTPLKLLKLSNPAAEKKLEIRAFTGRCLKTSSIYGGRNPSKYRS